MGRRFPCWLLVGCEQSRYDEWGEEVMKPMERIGRWMFLGKVPKGSGAETVRKLKSNYPHNRYKVMALPNRNKGVARYTGIFKYK